MPQDVPPDMPDVTFRPAEIGDWPRVADLLSAADLPLEGAEDHLGDFQLAERDGTLVGCAALERYGRDGLLRSVAVWPEERGAGLGRALVGRVLERAAADGLHTVALLTTTAPDYFPRFGFRAIPRAAVPAAVQASVEFREACPASAVAMRLELVPA